MKTPPNQKAFEGAAGKHADTNPNELSVSIRALMLQGSEVRLLDFAPEDRAQANGIIATLRDELPVSCRWVTIRESHLSETRLRAKSYHVKGEHLRSEVQL